MCGRGGVWKGWRCIMGRVEVCERGVVGGVEECGRGGGV